MNMYIAFMHHVTAIVTIMFIGIKLKKRVSDKHYFQLGVPVFFGLFSIIIILQAFRINGMIFDLRAIPILLVAYRFGWKSGLLASILPIIYRIYIGGPTMWQGVILGILLAVVIGSYFHKNEGANDPYRPIHMRELLNTTVIFYILQWFLGTLTIPISPILWLEITAMSVFLGGLSMLAIAFIINDDCLNHTQKKELLYYSSYDSLTKLPNFRFFKAEADKILAKQTSVSLIMIDIDYFKNYNDTHGHPKGDVLLRTIAQIFKDQIREQDLAARYGGEEFVILIPGTSQEEAAALAERIRVAVEQYSFYGKDQQPGKKVTISMGLSCSTDAVTLKELIAQADAALYQSKDSGRNTFRFYKTA